MTVMSAEICFWPTQFNYPRPENCKRRHRYDRGCKLLRRRSRFRAHDVPLSFPQYTPDSPTTDWWEDWRSTASGTSSFPSRTIIGVLKISPDGIVTTFAGNGVAGNSGDDGPATQATLNAPSGLAFYAGEPLHRRFGQWYSPGNAEWDHHDIRRIGACERAGFR